ncbi:hypothetical protein NL676_005042 [Syzygium grande]|nr:hypothetical protein NL676_005042 [Syzygium grande]
MHLPIKKRRVSVCGTAEDADSSMTEPTGTQSGGPGSPPTETNNGAPSSSTAPMGNCYEVFLSFRGPDTGKGFVDRLYAGLVGAGICAFRDGNELLRQDEEIGPDLLAAIKNSKILIPVLSENYGSSKRCLDELVQMMERKNNDTAHVILPIFYEVEPAHVRHQIGSFGDAFRTRERHSDPTILEKWKRALNEVSSLKGWEANGYEGELVKSIIQKVLSELKKKFELVNPDNLVGIESHVEKVMEFVDNNSRATLFVGIHGMEGIGKTTLAKTIYKKLSNQFEYRSFIADIRESYKHNGLAYLQNQLISDVLKQNNQVDSKDEGIEFISSKFGTKKVLIVLDDVDNDDQLKALAGNHDWFSSGSRIIVTTRNKSILVNSWVDYNYEHEEMDKDKSLILFSRHAFRRDSPPSEFEDLTHDVVSTTRGLPLTLEVLGSFLCAKEPTLWRSTINKLRKVPHKKVREKLKISYEALEYTQKQIFLDIACFFIGTDERIASYMWDACDFFPEEGIEVLRFMSLIKVGDNHELIMHDQLRDLGREIVREESKLEPQHRSRLWDLKEVLKVLKGNKGTEKIKAIYLSEGNSEGSGKTVGQSGDFPTDEQFKNLTSLRFLHMSGAHFRGDFKNSIDELRWLRWWNCPLTFEANNFHAKELLALDLSASKISQEWRGWSSIMMAKKLKYLDLTNCQSLEGTFFLSAFKILELACNGFIDCSWKFRNQSFARFKNQSAHLASADNVHHFSRRVALKGMNAEGGSIRCKACAMHGNGSINCGFRETTAALAGHETSVTNEGRIREEGESKNGLKVSRQGTKVTCHLCIKRGHNSGNYPLKQKKKDEEIVRQRDTRQLVTEMHHNNATTQKGQKEDAMKKEAREAETSGRALERYWKCWVNKISTKEENRPEVTVLKTGGHKKGASKDKSKHQLSLGDLVLAKVKGHPAWPAKISRLEDWHQTPDSKRHFVHFFGTRDLRFLSLDSSISMPSRAARSPPDSSVVLSLPLRPISCKVFLSLKALAAGAAGNHRLSLPRKAVELFSLLPRCHFCGRSLCVALSMNSLSSLEATEGRLELSERRWIDLYIGREGEGNGDTWR